MVMDRTNIEPTNPRPSAMTIGSDVIAKAPVTPSNEKAASRTSR